MTKRKPTDATLRNVRAARKRNLTLEARIRDLEKRVKKLERLTKT